MKHTFVFSNDAQKKEALYHYDELMMMINPVTSLHHLQNVNCIVLLQVFVS